MRKKLYWTIQKFSLRYAYFMFFDTTPYLADQLFIRHKVRVWFEREYTKNDAPYIAIFCHVRKKDVPQFLDALEDLKKRMILCGHPEYEAEISSFMDEMKQMKGDNRQNEVHTDCKAKQELICKGWFLPPNTYDCGSFVVNGTAVVRKEPKHLITAGNQHNKELIFYEITI